MKRRTSRLPDQSMLERIVREQFEDTTALRAMADMTRKPIVMPRERVEYDSDGHPTSLTYHERVKTKPPSTGPWWPEKGKRR